MRILFLVFSLLFLGNLNSDGQHFLSTAYGDEQNIQEDPSSMATSCEEVLHRAMALNESFKNAVSEGGRRAFELEAEKYFHTALLEKLPSCVTYASSDSDTVLSKLIFELARSYSDSSDDFIALELARFYSRNQEMTKTILLDYEKIKRQELVETLRRGLIGLYYDKAEEASRLKKLSLLLDEIVSK